MSHSPGRLQNYIIPTEEYSHPTVHTELCTRSLLLKPTNKYSQRFGRRNPTLVTTDKDQLERGYTVEQTEKRIHKVRRDLTETIIDGFEKEPNMKPRNEKES